MIFYVSCLSVSPPPSISLSLPIWRRHVHWHSRTRHVENYPNNCIPSQLYKTVYSVHIKFPGFCLSLILWTLSFASSVDFVNSYSYELPWSLFCSRLWTRVHAAFKPLRPRGPLSTFFPGLQPAFFGAPC